jgi:hypothetical protein
MENSKEYYYTYYSYEEWGRGYFGSRGCNCLPEEDIKYFGSFSDKNFKPTQKIILKSDYATREEAYTDEIILQKHYKVVENPHFANKAYQTSTGFRCPPITTEKKRKSSRNNIKKLMEEKRGIFSLTVDERSRNSKAIYESGKGLASLTYEERVFNAKRAGQNVTEKKRGIHALTKEQRVEIAKENYNNGNGIATITPEKRSEYSRKNASQKWMCLETGHICNAGGLAYYQKARGIDRSKRIRIE